jgi:hypothetical protein
MNRYVKTGLIAALGLIATLGLLVYGLKSLALETQSPRLLMSISVGTGSLLIALILYGLWRGYRSGVVIVFSRFSATSFRRATEPIQYWFWFCSYIFLIPLILWLMFDRLLELQRRYRQPLPVYTQDSEDRYYGPRESP